MLLRHRPWSGNKRLAHFFLLSSLFSFLCGTIHQKICPLFESGFGSGVTGSVVKTNHPCSPFPSGSAFRLHSRGEEGREKKKKYIYLSASCKCYDLATEAMNIQISCPQLVINRWHELSDYLEGDDALLDHLVPRLPN